MKITIGHLYSDLLNLYGDDGNIKALKYHLEEQGINVEIKNMTIGDKKDFSDIDFLYIGSGTENNIILALEDLKNDKDKIKDYLNDNKILLSTGNSIELFGNYIITNKKIKALGIIDYVCMHQDRIVKDVKSKTNIVNEDIIGFENHDGKNLSMNEDIFNEGSFYGGYVIGPILVRNPELCSLFVHKLIDSKEKDFKYGEEDYEFEKEAYKKAVKII
jgi:CobQ-like glutamine amidotransferase family enzyme